MPNVKDYGGEYQLVANTQQAFILDIPGGFVKNTGANVLFVNFNGSGVTTPIAQPAIDGCRAVAVGSFCAIPRQCMGFSAISVTGSFIQVSQGGNMQP